MTMSSCLGDLAWPRRTERLVLRRAQVADAPLTWRYRRRSDVAQWLPMLPTTLAVHTEMFCAPQRLATTLLVELQDSEIGAAVLDGDSGDVPGGVAGRVIGDLKFDVVDAWAQDEIASAAKEVQAEIGWAFDPRVHGHGYATEAVRELLRIAFTELGLRRVTAYCFAENDPSWRLMERVGMRREAHTIGDALHRDGTWRDGYLYALLADERPDFARA